MPPVDTDNGPPNKAPRNNAGPGLIRADVDPNSSDHMVAMTQLKEQIASLQKQLNQRDAQLLSKDKLVGRIFYTYTHAYIISLHNQEDRSCHFSCQSSFTTLPFSYSSIFLTVFIHVLVALSVFATLTLFNV